MPDKPHLAILAAAHTRKLPCFVGCVGPLNAVVLMYANFIRDKTHELPGLAAAGEFRVAGGASQTIENLGPQFYVPLRGRGYLRSEKCRQQQRTLDEHRN
jgi:hypothetical protein